MTWRFGKSTAPAIRGGGILVCVGIVSVAGCMLRGGKASAQNNAPDWPHIERTLEVRSKAFSSVSAQYLLEFIPSPEIERNVAQTNRQTFEAALAKGEIAPGSAAPRGYEAYARTATCRYIRQGDLWREDDTEAFPGGSRGELLHHFLGFDGEKYYAFNGDTWEGLIAPSLDDLKSLASRFWNVTDSTRFLGLSDPVDILPKLRKNGIAFKDMGRDLVNGNNCVKYSSSYSFGDNRYYRLTLWISPDQGLSIIKKKGEYFSKYPQNSHWAGSVTVTNVFALDQAPNGMYVNRLVQEDLFKTEDASLDGKLHWQYSRRFTLHDVEIGETTPTIAFAAQFPPGASVEDKINAPGHISIVGADFRDASMRMKNGVREASEPLDGTLAPQPLPGEKFPLFVDR